MGSMGTILTNPTDASPRPDPAPRPRGESALRKEVVATGKYSLVYVVGQAISRAVGFFMIPLYTRYIAPSHYGAMELVEILYGAFQMIISMGVADAMSRFYYAEKDPAARDRVVSTVVVGFGALGLPLVLGLLAAAPAMARLFLEDARYQECFQIAIATAWFGMLCEVGYSYLRMRYLAKLFVTVTTLQLVAAVGLNIYLIAFRGWDILGIFYSTLITQGVTGLVLAATILSRVGVRVCPTVLRRLVAFGLPLVPPQIGLTLGFSSNRFFLRWLGSPDAAVALALVGLFSLGHKFGVVVNRFINVPFNSFWGPRRLELLLRGEPHAKETVARMATYACLCTVFFALALSASVGPVVEIMADPSYHGCQVVVPFVALAYVALGLETHFKTGILYRRKTLWDTAISLVAVAVILGWNFAFVPHFGLVGAATSNLAGFTVRVGLIYVVSQRLYPLPFEVGRIATLFVVAGGLFAASQLIGFGSPWLTLLARTAFVSLFPVVLYGCRFFREGELEFAGQAVQRVCLRLRSVA
jgi:O-antigen/teichoic acid export membrane protein